MNRKRDAFEPASELLAQEAPLPAHAGRPGSITLGATLVLCRALLSILWFIAFSLTYPAIALEVGLDAEERTIVYVIVAAFNAATLLVLALFSWLIWRGSNTARVITMFVLTVSILSAAVGHFAYGDAITLHTTLLTLAFDILILLALSSRQARAWARRSRS